MCSRHTRNTKPAPRQGPANKRTLVGRHPAPPAAGRGRPTPARAAYCGKEAARARTESGTGGSARAARTRPAQATGPLGPEGAMFQRHGGAGTTDARRPPETIHIARRDAPSSFPDAKLAT